MKYFLLLVFALGLSSMLNAQQWQIEVQVKDSKKQALAYANVLLSSKQGQIIAFAMSDEQGQAILKAESSAQKLWLTASLLGYVSDTLVLDVKSEIQKVVLNLQVSAFELEAVQINEYKLPYKVAGDTTTFAADKYAQGNERNVEELIKKIPGVKVSKNGEIQYKGKSVSRVLLEHDAIFGSRYAIATKGMDADVVDEVQFIDHYLENQLLNGVEDSDELVMNIKVKENRKKVVFGSAELSGGLPERYAGRLNLFSLLEKHKAVFLGNAGRRSNGNFSAYQYFRSNSGFDTYDYSRPASSWVSLTPFTPTELDGQDFNNNATQLGATNLILNPNQQVKIRGFLTAFNDKTRIRNESFFKELFLDQTFELLERENVQQNTQGLDFNIEAIIQTSKQSNLSIKAMTYRDQEDTRMTNFISNFSDSLASVQTLVGRNQTQQYRINYVNRLSAKQALVFNGTFYQNQRPNTFGFLNPANEENIQSLQHRTEDIDVQLSLMGKKKKLSYRHSLLAQNKTDFFRLQRSQRDPDLNQFEVLARDGRHFKQQKLSGQTKLNWEAGKTTFGIALEAGMINLTLPEQNLLDQTMPFYEWNASLTSELTRYLSGVLSYSFSQHFPDLRALNDLEVYNSNRSLSRGLGEINNLLDHTFFGSLNYENTNRLIQAYLNIFYSQNPQNYGSSYRYEGLTSISQVAWVGASNLLNASWEVDKFLYKISTNIALKINYSRQESPMLNQQLEQERVRSEQMGMRFSITSVTNGWIDINLQLEASTGNFQRLDAAISPEKGAFSQNQRWLTTCELQINPHEKWSINPAIRYFILPTVGLENQRQQFGLGDLHFYYDWKDQISFSLGIYNLFNSGNFTQEQINTQSYFRQSIFLNRRAFDLGFKVQL